MSVQKNKTLLFLALAILFSVMLAAQAQAQFGFSDPTVSRETGGIGLIPVEEDIDGGAVTVGATAQVVVLFRNESGSEITVSGINLYPSSTVTADVTLNKCSEGTLSPQADCAIALSVNGVQQGPWRVEMLLSHSGRSRLATATVTGRVEAAVEGAGGQQADVEISPEDLDFGQLSRSIPITRSVTLRNITSSPIEVAMVRIDAPLQSGLTLDARNCETLKAAQACVAAITWTPLTTGPISGSLIVEHDGPSGVASIRLSGSYTPDVITAAQIFPDAVPGMGLLISDRDEVNFGESVDGPVAMTLSLVNIGDSDLEFTDIRLSDPKTGLLFGDKGCSPATVLAPTEACPLTIRWTPLRSGPVQDDIQIIHTGVRGTLVIPVRGRAIDQDEDSTRNISTNVEVIEAADDVFDLDAEDDLGEISGAVTGEDGAELSQEEKDKKNADIVSLLNGFVVTSHSTDRAILSGPTGVRVVRDGEKVILSGRVWKVGIKRAGVALKTKSGEAILLFDQALSSDDRTSSSSEDSISDGDPFESATSPASVFPSNNVGGTSSSGATESAGSTAGSNVSSSGAEATSGDN